MNFVGISQLQTFLSDFVANKSTFLGNMRNMRELWDYLSFLNVISDIVERNTHFASLLGVGTYTSNL